jgi:urease accessory protein UreF
MANPFNLSPRQDEVLAGDVRRLAEQLGPVEDLAMLGPGFARSHAGRIHDLPSLQGFLRSYVEDTLVRLELPTIRRAHGHAQGYEARELIHLDRVLDVRGLPAGLAEASRRVGWSQLRRLRPLRDQRLVQRYLHAVETGEAHGWHTVVYGVALSLYSLPLGQGLAGYGIQTIRGFVYGAAGRLALTQGECARLEEDAGTGLNNAVRALLAPVDGSHGLRV